MRTLLSAGANPYATFCRWTPTGTAVNNHEESRDSSVRDLLQDGQVYQKALAKAVLVHELLDQNDMVHPILELEMLDASRCDGLGRTLLHMACHNHDINDSIDSLRTTTGLEIESKKPSFLGCLLAHGADPLAIDTFGNNLLHHMFLSNERRGSHTKNPSTIAQLTKLYPTLINQANVDGKTPLHMALKHAALHCDTAPAEAMLRAGADPFVIDNNGNGCLHVVAFLIYESADVRSLFKKLLHRGLDVNARNKRGETPIFNLNKHLTWSTGKLDERIVAADALSLFESAGADLFVRDHHGNGLLHVAAKETREPVKNDHFSFFSFCKPTKPAEPSIARFQVLLSKGLDPMSEDAQKRTPLDVAAACGKESVLKLFENDDSHAIPVMRNYLGDDDGDDDGSDW